jgi:hypothetical protein
MTARRSKSRKKPKAGQSWPQVVLLVLTTLGVVANIAGVLDASPILLFCLAGALLAAAAWAGFLGHRHAFVASPRATAAGITAAAVLIASLGVYRSLTDPAPQQAADREVCAAAEDYDEAYVAAATQWAATGLRTPETERADSVAAESLDRLSRRAVRSGNEDVKVLVHDMRMRANLGLAQEKADVGDAISNLQGSWTSLKVLVSLCKEMGYPVTEYARLPVEPSVEQACRLVDQLLDLTSASDARTWTGEQHEHFTALLNMFMYHGLNSPDDRFATKARDFAGTVDKDLGPSFDRLGPVYGSCVARGYHMKLADSVPREYVVP